MKKYRGFTIVLDCGIESDVCYYELYKDDTTFHYESGEGVDRHDALRKAKKEIDLKYSRGNVE